MTHVIRPYRVDDEAWALALNNEAVPDVNAHTQASWRELCELALTVRVAETNEQQSALLVLFSPGATYSSENYRWFSAEYNNFIYVDRIIVSAGARGSGVGRTMYEHAFDLCTELRAPRLTCEVNERPPNPGSMAFHQKLGFKEVGVQGTEGGNKRVALLARTID